MGASKARQCRGWPQSMSSNKQMQASRTTVVEEGGQDVEGQDEGGQEKERTLILHRRKDDGGKQEGRDEKGSHKEGDQGVGSEEGHGEEVDNEDEIKEEGKVGDEDREGEEEMDSSQAHGVSPDMNLEV